MRNIAPDVTIYQFLDMLDKEKVVDYNLEKPTPKILVEDIANKNQNDKG